MKQPCFKVHMFKKVLALWQILCNGNISQREEFSFKMQGICEWTSKSESKLF